MSFWLREVAGWTLVLLGLLTFTEVYGLCVERRPVEAGFMTVVGAFIFRGGIHLLKVAVAARVCTQAQDRLYPAPPPAPASRPATAGRRP
jgi:hypothetical protein